MRNREQEIEKSKKRKIWYNKSSQEVNEWDQPQRSPYPQVAAPIAPVQQSNASSQYANDYGAKMEDGAGFEDFELKSVYVRNLPSNISVSEIEEEFKHFGAIKPDGVFLRTRKNVIGVCYAFVEFEDMTSVDNAIKASPIYLGGRQVYIERRRPNPAGVRGARRGGGRGRGGYPTETPRGRFGGRGSYGRGNKDGSDYRPSGNGYYRGGR